MERIDKEGIINAALRAAGFNIDKDNTEKILQVIDFVRNNKDATLKDIVKVNIQVDELNGIESVTQ